MAVPSCAARASRDDVDAPVDNIYILYVEVFSRFSTDGCWLSSRPLLLLCAPLREPRPSVIVSSCHAFNTPRDTFLIENLAVYLRYPE